VVATVCPIFINQVGVIGRIQRGRFSLEQNLEFVEDDELCEVTPLSIRLRKKHLTENARVQASRGKRT
jgi:GTP-binding protein